MLFITGHSNISTGLLIFIVSLEHLSRKEFFLSTILQLQILNGKNLFCFCCFCSFVFFVFFIITYTRLFLLSKTSNQPKDYQMWAAALWKHGSTYLVLASYFDFIIGYYREKVIALVTVVKSFLGLINKTCKYFISSGKANSLI